MYNLMTLSLPLQHSLQVLRFSSILIDPVHLQSLGCKCHVIPVDICISGMYSCNTMIKIYRVRVRLRFMVFNSTYNNISVISWQSILLVVETRETRRKPPTCHKSLTNYVVSNTPRLSGVRTHCIVSCKSNYHTIMTTTVPQIYLD